MWIESLQQAADRPIDELLRIDLAHVGGLDGRQRLGECLVVLAEAVLTGQHPPTEEPSQQGGRNHDRHRQRQTSQGALVVHTDMMLAEEGLATDEDLQLDG